MNIYSHIPDSIINSLRKVKGFIPKPIINLSRSLRGIYKVSPFTQFNNYSTTDKAKSILPKSFDSNKATPLCYIMKEKGSDKGLYQGLGKHNFTTLYYAAFKKLRNQSIRIFEVGLGTTNTSLKSNMGESGTPGASLRGWHTFFPNARIFGADIDKSILFKEDRIVTYYTDQTAPEIIHKIWESEGLQEGFDVIIDDGLHEFEANRCFFENSIHKLNKGGLYIVEDILHIYIPQWEQLLEGFPSKYPNLRFSFIRLPNDYNPWDNNLLVIEKLA